MKINEKFVAFLNGLSDYNPLLIESIINGYNIIYESTENMVSNIKNTIGTPEENPLDQEVQPIDGESEVQPDELEPPVDDIEQSTNQSI